MRNITAILTFFFIMVLGLALINGLGLSVPLSVTTTQRASELSVVGEGKVDVVPDTAYIDVGVTVNDAATVKEAQQSIDKTNNAIVAAMTKLGVKKADIKTSNYSVYPNQVFEGSTSRITGYNGNVTITIKVNDTQKASQVIAAATTAGANQIQGTRFVVEDPQKYRVEAREKAIANAREQAQKLAKDLDIKLGKVVNIVEYSPSSEVPMYSESMKAGLGGGGGPQIEAGSQTINSVVTLYFEKK